MPLINCTPHAIVLQTAEGERIHLPASGTLARIATIPSAATVQPGVLVPVKSATLFGPVEGLPPPAPGVWYIVSGLVASRCAHRTDVLSPGTGPNDNPIRENGQVVAVTCLLATV